MSSAHLGGLGGIRSLFFKVDPFSEVWSTDSIVSSDWGARLRACCQAVRDVEAFRASNIYMTFVFSGLVCAYSIYAFIMYAHDPVRARAHTIAHFIHARLRTCAHRMLPGIIGGPFPENAPAGFTNALWSRTSRSRPWGTSAANRWGWRCVGDHIAFGAREVPRTSAAARMYRIDQSTARSRLL
jgi:hypothetical protein